MQGVCPHVAGTAAVYQGLGISKEMSAAHSRRWHPSRRGRASKADDDFSFVAEVIQTKQQTNIYFARM
jgi:hypothetical protein